MTPGAAVARREVEYGGRRVRLADLPRYAKFYRKLEDGGWERHTLDAIRTFADRDTTVIDIGAWMGVTPFYAAQSARAVIAVEPDPDCVAILRDLARDHQNVTVVEGALSPLRAVRIHAVDGFGSSETSVLDIGDGDERSVFGVPMSDILARAGGGPLLVKIDIEGYEFAARGEIARLRGTDVRAVQIALHPQLYEKSLRGSRLVARLRTAREVWRMSRIFAGLLRGPQTVHYRNAASYILFGVLLRRVPKGADFLFCEPRARSLP